MEMLFSNITEEDELSIQRDRIISGNDTVNECITKAYSQLKVFMKTKEYDKLLSKENINVAKTAATVALVPFPFNINAQQYNMKKQKQQQMQR